MAERPRLWGIDLIAGIYALATLVLLWLFSAASAGGQCFAVVLGPLCAILSIGLFLRREPIRVLMVWLLGLSLVMSVLLLAYAVAGLLELVQFPPNKDPDREMMRAPGRFATTLSMFLYLRRETVREAFGQSDGPDEYRVTGDWTQTEPFDSEDEDFDD